jgi:tetratricopeptide (TPR) repeat protein
VNFADAALDGGMPDTALNVTRSILQSNPRDVGARERQGAALARLNQPDAAMEAWRRALAVNPPAPAALLGLGRLRCRAAQGRGPMWRRGCGRIWRCPLTPGRRKNCCSRIFHRLMPLQRWLVIGRLA